MLLKFQNSGIQVVGTGAGRFLFQSWPRSKGTVSRNQIAPQAFNAECGTLGFCPFFLKKAGDLAMNQIIYLIGLIVVIMAILSFLGLR